MKKCIYSFFVLTLILGLNSCKGREKLMKYESDLLRIEQISEHTYLHISYLETESFGKVECNGLVIIDDREAIVLDTPVDDKTSTELIEWIEKKMKSKVKAVIASHFHLDCLGGLGAFHKEEIESYANGMTIAMVEGGSEPVPMKILGQNSKMKAGKQEVSFFYPGEGHTKDNIVVYASGDKVLFGGCLVKSNGAGKGNLADANVDQWSNTVTIVKSNFPEVKVVVPGHGTTGGIELLDYTIDLFETK